MVDTDFAGHRRRCIYSIRLRAPERVAKRKQTEKDKAFVYGAAVARLLGYANYKPKAGETPLTFAKRVDGTHDYQKQITPLWRILSLSNYSRLRPGVEQTNKARDTYQAIFKQTKPLRKARFLMDLLISARFYTALDTALEHEEPGKLYTWNPRNLRKAKPTADRKPANAKPTTGKQKTTAHTGKPRGNAKRKG